MHHVGIGVGDIAAALEELAANGAEVIDAEPRLGLGGHLVSFVHPRSLHGVLAEVVGV